jgi:hypothetical protein
MVRGALTGSRQLQTRNGIARDCNPEMQEKPNQFPSLAGGFEIRRVYRPRAGVALATSRLICLLPDAVAFG